MFPSSRCIHQKAPNPTSAIRPNRRLTLEAVLGKPFQNHLGTGTGTGTRTRIDPLGEGRSILLNYPRNDSGEWKVFLIRQETAAVQKNGPGKRHDSGFANPVTVVIMKTMNKSDVERLREEAWIGDAVLGLFAREWLLRHAPSLDNQERTATFQHMTGNQFLTAFGEPTAVEARIGRIYQQEGLEAAFRWMENEILPLFRKQKKW